jgi:hypothetical protein
MAIRNKLTIDGYASDHLVLPAGTFLARNSRIDLVHVAGYGESSCRLIAHAVGVKESIDLSLKVSLNQAFWP